MDQINFDSVDFTCATAINQIENLALNSSGYKNQIVENDYISDNVSLCYKRAKLIKLKPEEEKGVYKKEKIKIIFNQLFANYREIKYFISSDRLEFYYYNCEDVKDYGYGCAWRCIQTIIGTLKNVVNYDINLNNKNKNLSCNASRIKSFENKFQSIFLKYGGREVLEKLYLSCYFQKEIPNYLNEIEYAPHETQLGWAEPYICKLILHDLGLIGSLYLINCYNNNAFAPAEVFHKTIDFETFKINLLEHFGKDHKLPVIIDDSLITICIIGIYSNMDEMDSTTTLLIADPHVKAHDSGNTGIYQIVLDSKGNFDESLNTQPNLYGKRLMFEKGSWMAYFPHLD